MAISSRRERAFGQDRPPTVVDRLGIWLSARQVRRSLRSVTGSRVGDIGCGYHAGFARTILDEVSELVLLDVALSPDLRDHPKVAAIEGLLPGAMEAVPDECLDVVLCNSVLEHLWEPLIALREFHRVLAPGGVLLVNVPSWRGKRFLEASAFLFGASPVEEIDDHKTYYDPRDLWPLLVRAGFAPHAIRCFRHKLGLNTFARCRKPAPRREP